MASKPFFSKKKPFPLVLLLLCLTLTLLIHTTTYNLQPDEPPITSTTLRLATIEPPPWYGKLQYMLKIHSAKLKLGLVNVEADHAQVNGLADVTKINFEKVGGDKKWEDFFPEWVDENGKWGPMKCPEIPMPESYEKVDVVVAQVPNGVRDVFRLQVNLVVANVLVNSGWENGDDREMYVVFIGKSGPMWEIFRCDDIIWEEGDYKIYKPDLKRLQQKVNMPVGSCMIHSPSLQSAGGSDQDAEYALSKLLQMGTVTEYESEFVVLANRVRGISESLLTSFYISGLKLTLQIELLRARPTTLGEAFSLAHIVEARFEAIEEKEKEHIIEKKSNTIPLLQSEFASPEIKRSLDADEYICVDEVRSAIDGVVVIGESLVVILKWVQTSTSRTLLLLATFENMDVAMGMECKIQRRTWDPGIKIYFRQHLEGKVILKEWRVIRPWLKGDGYPGMACWITIVVYLLCFIRISVGVIV